MKMKISALVGFVLACLIWLFLNTPKRRTIDCQGDEWVVSYGCGLYPFPKE